MSFFSQKTALSEEEFRRVIGEYDRYVREGGEYDRDVFGFRYWRKGCGRRGWAVDVDAQFRGCPGTSWLGTVTPSLC